MEKPWPVVPLIINHNLLLNHCTDFFRPSKNRAKSSLDQLGSVRSAPRVGCLRWTGTGTTRMSLNKWHVTQKTHKKKRNDDDQPRKTIVKPIDFPWKSRLLISCTAAENPGPRSWTMKVTFIEGLGSRNWRGRGLRCVLLAAASYTPYI